MYQMTCQLIFCHIIQSSKSPFIFRSKMINPFVSALNFVSSSFSLLSGGGDLPKQNGIFILNQRNFKNALNQHELLMVKFYLPWCASCKSFAPEYLKLDQLLKAQNSQIKLGQVDADVETNLTKEYKVMGFPALRLFKQGTPLKYYGPKRAENIAAWLNKNFPEH